VARAGHSFAAGGIAPEEVVKVAPGKILAERSMGSGEHRRVFDRYFSYEPSTVMAQENVGILQAHFAEG
jgi:hypothetical protein